MEKKPLVVEVKIKGKLEKVFMHNKEVILSGGSINSPQLLLLIRHWSSRTFKRKRN